MKVPFVDLHAQYLTIKGEIDAAIRDVIAQSAYIRGPHVDAFEEAWARTIGVKHCVSSAPIPADSKQVFQSNASGQCLTAMANGSWESSEPQNQPQ